MSPSDTSPRYKLGPTKLGMRLVWAPGLAHRIDVVSCGKVWNDGRDPRIKPSDSERSQAPLLMLFLRKALTCYISMNTSGMYLSSWHFLRMQSPLHLPVSSACRTNEIVTPRMSHRRLGRDDLLRIVWKYEDGFSCLRSS